MSAQPSASPTQMSAMRSTARDIFLHALAESSIEKAFERNVEYGHGVLRIGQDLHDLGKYSRVRVVSLGKAAHAMAAALASKVGSGLEGIVACVADPPAQVPGFRYFRGGHPTPNAESVRVGEAILRMLEALDERSLALHMISGGGSAIVEKPISDTISLDDLIVAYRELVLSGGTIAEINAVRKHLSATKGGRLARAAAPAQQISILISDVPDNAPDSLASGTDDGGFHHRRELLRHHPEVWPAGKIPAVGARVDRTARPRRNAEERRSRLRALALVDHPLERNGGESGGCPGAGGRIRGRGGLPL